MLRVRGRVRGDVSIDYIDGACGVRGGITTSGGRRSGDGDGGGILLKT